MRKALLVAATLVAAASLTACDDSKPFTCSEGQHVEDQGYYALLPQWILGANGTMTMITVPIWQPNLVCVKNG